ncbi:peptidoglycan-associated lipoprotein [Limoniibacter endophyticus]|uniref:Peptidoglycan-associated protein n=2 Tax=Limoniibacter endophyticus TaxID=1565040 RepID=A0A8J3DKG3_9HYPH|nr:peptidoglycan-associated lipoprotein [Limoniibacter endophyticus]
MFFEHRLNKMWLRKPNAIVLVFTGKEGRVLKRTSKLNLNVLTVALMAGLALAGCASQKTPNSAADLGLGAGAATPGSSQDFTVNVGDRIFFDTDSTAIRADAQATLAKQAQWLNRYSQFSITIEGHADERGTREYNLALGSRRAAATRDFLVSQGVASNRLKTISYGKERPVAVCDDISCWSQNRRAVTVLNSGAGM